MTKAILFLIFNACAFSQAAVSDGASAGCPPGTTCDTNYQTLQAAIAAAGSTALLITKAWTVTSTLTPATGLRIQCTPTGLLMAGAGSFWMFRLSGANQSVSGCTFNANDRNNANGIQVSPGASNISLTSNTFTGNGKLTTGMVGIDIGNMAGSVANVYLGHNTCDTVYQCEVTYNTSPLRIEYEYCTNLSGDCIYNNTGLNSFTDGAILTVSHVTGENLHRYGLEWAGAGYRWIDFGFNSFSGDGAEGSAGGPGISGGTDGVGGNAGDQLIGGEIHDNIVTGKSASAGGGELFEIYGHDYNVYGNIAQCNLCANGFLYGTWNTVYRDNTVNGVGENNGGNNGYGFELNPAFIAGHYSVHDNIFDGNTCTNVEFVCISAGFDGDIIRGNRSFRSPGYFSTDVTGGFAGSLSFVTAQGAGKRPILVEANDANLLAPVNGFSLDSPGKFHWVCFHPFGSAHVTYLNNKCTNQNSTRFGYLLDAGNPAYFDNSSLFGTMSTNLTYLAGHIPLSNSSGLLVQGNLSLPGSGPAPPVSDFTLGDSLPGGAKFTTGGCSVSATTGSSTSGTYTSGTSGTCTVVVTMGQQKTARNGWACGSPSDLTTPDNTQKQTATTVTTVTFVGATLKGDVIQFGPCAPY